MEGKAHVFSGTAEKVAEGLAHLVAPNDVVLLLGGVDSGKTTLARALHVRIGGEVVDADLGQSTIGPPGVISLGTYQGGMRDGYFVGDTTPRGHLLPAVCGTVLMADRAHRPTLIDTDGFIAGPAGRAYKEALVELLSPDLLVLLAKGEELAFLRPCLRHCMKVASVRLDGVQRKDRGARVLVRERAFHEHLADSSEVSLPWDEVQIEGSLLGAGEAVSAEELSKMLGCRVVRARKYGDEAIAVIEGRPLSVAAVKHFLELSRLHFVQLADVSGLLVGCFRGGRFVNLGRILWANEENLGIAVPGGKPPEALRLGTLRLSERGEELGRLLIP